MTIDQTRLASLCRIGRLLDEAVDLADACGETLVSAQVAQVIHDLDTQIARAGPPQPERRPVDPSQDRVD